MDSLVVLVAVRYKTVAVWDTVLAMASLVVPESLEGQASSEGYHIRVAAVETQNSTWIQPSREQEQGPPMDTQMKDKLIQRQPMVQ